jgi:hypothetical protein
MREMGGEMNKKTPWSKIISDERREEMWKNIRGEMKKRMQRLYTTPMYIHTHTTTLTH